MVVDLGNRISVTPVSNGYLLEDEVLRSFFGGLALNERLANMMHGQLDDPRMVRQHGSIITRLH